MCQPSRLQGRGDFELNEHKSALTRTRMHESREGVLNTCRNQTLQKQSRLLSGCEMSGLTQTRNQNEPSQYDLKITKFKANAQTCAHRSKMSCSVFPSLIDNREIKNSTCQSDASIVMASPFFQTTHSLSVSRRTGDIDRHPATRSNRDIRNQTSDSPPAWL